VYSPCELVTTERVSPVVWFFISTFAPLTERALPENHLRACEQEREK
jgi:hypothetical protein